MAIIYKASRLEESGLVHPKLKEAAEALKRFAPFPVVIKEVDRSWTRSNELFAIYQRGGPRAAPGGKSPHNPRRSKTDKDANGKPKIYVFAFDGYPVIDGRELLSDKDANHPAWQEYYKVIRGVKGIKSGADFGDGPHVEVDGWESMVLPDETDPTGGASRGFINVAFAALGTVVIGGVLYVVTR